ncbi:hypothetical protein CcCBS67573_g07722 [Chytriomyces confervae]|uniref:LysM domain-containing protein n=1 Tax=Chytriomyces confervae TaxID=246404 RepID=A0A507ETT9_9FUNG|nr:hypothetical protein CcCBS67573_g07722 [Chytriomyces confervae]
MRLAYLSSLLSCVQLLHALSLGSNTAGRPVLGHINPAAQGSSLAAVVGCQYTYHVSNPAGETCLEIQAATGLTVQQLVEINTALDCSKRVEYNTFVCTAGPDPSQAVASVAPNCLLSYTLMENESCSAIQAAFDMDATTFTLLNPLLDCSRTPASSTPVCLEASVSSSLIGGPPTSFTPVSVAHVGNCNSLVTVASPTACLDISAQARISVTLLNEWNGNLNCWGLKQNDTLCVGVGAVVAPFLSSTAVEPTRVTSATSTTTTTATTTATSTTTSNAAEAPSSPSPSPSPVAVSPSPSPVAVSPSPAPAPPAPSPSPSPSPSPEAAAASPSPAEEPAPSPSPAQASPVRPPASSSSSGNVLIRGSGSGTYFYDVEGRTCNGEGAYNENQAYTSCEPSAPPYTTLANRRNNNIVALALDQMNANKAGLCGKRVIVKYNGQVVDATFVVWDSCAACTGGVKLDFSVSALSAIEPAACTLGNVGGIEWEVVDEQVIPYVA